MPIKAKKNIYERRHYDLWTYFRNINIKKKQFYKFVPETSLKKQFYKFVPKTSFFNMEVLSWLSLSHTHLKTIMLLITYMKSKVYYCVTELTTQ